MYNIIIKKLVYFHHYFAPFYSFGFNGNSKGRIFGLSESYVANSFNDFIRRRT